MRPLVVGRKRCRAERGGCRRLQDARGCQRLTQDAGKGDCGSENGLERMLCCRRKSGSERWRATLLPNSASAFLFCPSGQVFSCHFRKAARIFRCLTKPSLPRPYIFLQFFGVDTYSQRLVVLFRPRQTHLGTTKINNLERTVLFTHDRCAQYVSVTTSVPWYVIFIENKLADTSGC